MDNIKTGYSFLAKNDFDSAINTFSNAINADTKDIEAHFGLSKAYYFLYKETNASAYKQKSLQYANKCKEINPKHAIIPEIETFLNDIQNDNTKNKAQLFNHQTTYDKSQQENNQNLIINSEKDFDKNNNKEDKGTLVVSPVKAFLGIGCISSFMIFGVVIFSLIKMSNSNDKNNNKIEKITSNLYVPSKSSQVASGISNGTNGSILWLIYQTKAKNCYLEYENLDKAGTKNETPIINKVNKVIDYEDVIYIFSDTDFEARNIQTKEIILNLEIFSKKYTQLAQGVGKVLDYQEKGLEIITKNGDRYYYLFVNQKLYSEAEKKQLDESYMTQNGYIEEYLWRTQDKNTLKKSFFLLKNFRNPFQLSPRFNQTMVYELDENAVNEYNNTPTTNSYQKFPTTKATFLEANMVYADKELAIIANKTAIGATGKALYTCVEAQTGNVIWEITAENSKLLRLDENKIAKNEWERHKMSRYGDILVFYNANFKESPQEFAVMPSACAINIKTGKIIWEKLHLF